MTTSMLRTIRVLAQTQGYGVVLSPPALRWSAAQPDDDLDYSLDLSALLTDAGDTLSSVSLSTSPWGAGELVASNLTAAGSIITAWLSGGVPGRDYTVKVEAQTVGGRLLEYLPHLLIGPDLAANPIPAPPNAGFSVALTWNLAQPMTLTLGRPLSSSNAAALF
jgi:hypothetical protein